MCIYLQSHEILTIVRTHPHSYWLYIKKNHIEFYNYIVSLPGGKFSEKLYRYINPHPAVCLTCGSTDVAFQEFNTGFKKYCSPKCASESEFTKIAQQKFWKNSNNVAARKAKTHQTNLKKYGAIHWCLTESGKDHNSKTNSAYYRTKYPLIINGRSRKQYVNAARYLTNKIYNQYKSIIDPSGIRSKDWVVDHIYSISDGFKNNVPLDVICHYSNLRIISKEDNSSKKDCSEKSLTQLYEDFHQTD